LYVARFLEACAIEFFPREIFRLGDPLLVIFCSFIGIRGINSYELINILARDFTSLDGMSTYLCRYQLDYVRRY